MLRRCKHNSRDPEIQAEAEEKKRADKIQMAQIEVAKDQVKIQAEKELAIKHSKMFQS